MRKIKGFTLVELLVVVVIIGILAAIALPNFIGAQKKAKAAAVKGNMRTIQIASESYATDSGGSYGKNADILPYLPGGTNKIGGTPGTLPQNPVDPTKTALGDAALADSKAIAGKRAAAPAANGVAGNCAYSQADTGNSYAVLGSDADGFEISGVGGKVLVLSNQ